MPAGAGSGSQQRGGVEQGGSLCRESPALWGRSGGGGAGGIGGCYAVRILGKAVAKGKEEEEEKEEGGREKRGGGGGGGGCGKT